MKRLLHTADRDISEYSAHEEPPNDHEFKILLVSLLQRGVSRRQSHNASQRIRRYIDQFKVSVGLRQQLPTSIRFCTLQEESSEDLALVRAINEARVDSEDILLFDRGISKGETFGEFEAKDYKFVTRLNVGRLYHVITTHAVSSPIIEDLTVNLYAKGSKTQLPRCLRLIKKLNKEGNEILFLTNLFDMSALEITELYRRRWDIEVFFKFIKQNLGYKHFLSHSMNGMRVYIYMVLITALVFFRQHLD